MDKTKAVLPLALFMTSVGTIGPGGNALSIRPGGNTVTTARTVYGDREVVPVEVEEG